MIELRHLHTLRTLRQAGSLVEAAERLHVTQSALSHQLRDLEDRLGTSLVARRTRPLRFTAAGERLLSLAAEVLPRVQRAEQDLARLASGSGGRLHLAIECHSCFQWLMPALDSFREGWPEVELDLSAAFSFAPLPALGRGDLDMVITADPVPEKGITYLPLFRYQLVLAVARTSPLAARRYVMPADLADETLITYPVEAERLDIFTHFLTPAGVVPQRRNAELTTMMLQLVAAGRGVAALPNWALTEYLDSRLLATVSLGEEGIWRTLYLAVASAQAELPYIKAFATLAREQCFETLAGIRAAR